MTEPLSAAALAILSAVADNPMPPKIMQLHALTRDHHVNPFDTLLTAARLDRAGLVKSKDADGYIGYHITVAGLAALGD